MKKRKIVSMLLSLLMVLGVLLLPIQKVYATEGNVAVQQARNGVVQVAVNVLVDKQEVGFLTVGSGFLVGTSENAQTVITNFHVVHSVTKDQVRELLDLSGSEKIELNPQIVVRRDLRIDAEVYKESEVGDFTILKLEQPIYDRVPLALGDSTSVQTTQEIFALGFPGIVQQIQTDSKYTFDDVNVTEGIVSKVSDVAIVSNPIPTITHSARVSEGNSGGPLVNASGEVVGINTFISRDDHENNDYFYATQINEIRSSLDALGVDYLKGGSQPVPTEEPDSTEPSNVEPTEEPMEEPVQEPEEDNTALYDQLNALIEEAKKPETTENKTEESVKNLDAALADATSVWNNTTSTAEELNTAKDDLQKAISGLIEEQKGLSPVLIIGIAAAVIIVIIVVVILVIVSANKKKKLEAEKEKQKRAMINNINGKNNGQPYQSPVGQGVNNRVGQPPQWNQVQRPPMGNDGSEETGILNEGSSETTLLGGQNIPGAYLIRRKNNERISISKQIFKIGKERRKVDYCVADNTNVSRTHADILYRNGEFYITDNHATNGTSVNGASVAAGQERKLNNNDIIKLADEEFQFRTF